MQFSGGLANNGTMNPSKDVLIFGMCLTILKTSDERDFSEKKKLVLVFLSQNLTITFFSEISRASKLDKLKLHWLKDNF